MLNRVEKNAQRMRDEYVSTEHLLIALSNAKSEPAGRLLQENGVTKDAILKVLVSIRGSQKITDQNPEEKYQALQRYTRDLTELAWQLEHATNLQGVKTLVKVVTSPPLYAGTR